MSTSLIPERPLLISPTLAATIGLEEAVFLHVLSELLRFHPTQCRNERTFMNLSAAQLQEALPFWTRQDIVRVQKSLQELGLLLIEKSSNPDCELLAINQNSPSKPTTSSQPGSAYASAQTPTPPPTPAFAPSTYTPPASTPMHRTSNGAQLLPSHWQPDASVYQQCAQRNIPREFVDRAIGAFTLYHRERGKPQYSWQRTFLTWVITDWEKQRSFQNAKVLEGTMSSDWLPSEEALSILEYGGISLGFMEAAVPEFVLYWKEKGAVSSEWNSRFIAHVRRQWEGYRHALEHDTTPRPIPLNFTPDPACYDVLGMANIDLDFAEAQLKEFVLYWRDRNEIHRSWNTKFLQHVKFKWAQQSPTGSNLLDKFTDRSWAE